MENHFYQVTKQNISALCAQYLASVENGCCTGELFTSIIKEYEDPAFAFYNHDGLWRDHFLEYLCTNLLPLDSASFRVAKVIPCKTRNSISWRIALPKDWIVNMGISPEKKTVFVMLSDQKIVIRAWNEDQDFSTSKFKKLNIMFSTTLTTSAKQYKGCRISLSDSWMKQLQITQNDRIVALQFDHNEITIKKM